jgi:hypothetical protein
MEPATATTASDVPKKKKDDTPLPEGWKKVSFPSSHCS